MLSKVDMHINSYKNLDVRHLAEYVAGSDTTEEEA